MKIVVTRFSEPFAEVKISGDRVAYSGHGQLFVRDYVEQKMRKLGEGEVEVAKRLPKLFLGYTRANIVNEDE